MRLWKRLEQKRVPLAQSERSHPIEDIHQALGDHFLAKVTLEHLVVMTVLEHWNMLTY